MQTAQEAIQTILEQAAKACPETRIARRMDIGDAIHQGDVYIHRVADDYPHGKELGTRQVAVGTTIGSRHIAEGNVSVYAKAQPFPMPSMDERCWDACTGPVIVAQGTWTLTHPEHAHHRLPAGCYVVTYQLDERTRRAVED